MSSIRFHLIALAIIVFAVVAWADVPDVYAIKDVRIVPVIGAVIEKGVIVVRDGLIAAVGADVAIPKDAHVIDGKGLTAYPAFINASSHLGMDTSNQPQEPQTFAEIQQLFNGPRPQQPATSARGYGNANAQVHAQERAADKYAVDKTAMQALQKLGFGATLTAPIGGVFLGKSALVSLREGAVNGLLIKPDVAEHLSLGRGGFGFGGGYPSSLMGRIALARQTLLDAKWQADCQAVYAKDPHIAARPAFDSALDALQPVLRQEMPIIAEAATDQSIRRTLALAKEFNLKVILDGCGQAYDVADMVKAAQTPLLVSIDFPEAPQRIDDDNPPTYQAMRERALAPANLGKLFKAGVTFAITTAGLRNVPDFTRNLRQAVQRGLPKDAAIEALTMTPARVLGVDDRLGSLEVGKIANIVLVEGDLFDARGSVKQLFVDGHVIDLGPALLPGGFGGGGRRGGGGGGGGRFGRTPLATPPADVAAQPTPTATTPPPAFYEGVYPPPAETTAKTTLIRNATVWTVSHLGTLKNTDILIENGKIAAIGKNLKAPADTRIIDAAGKHVTPGLIDCHSHTAIEGGVNEGTNSCTAECRIQDVIDAKDIDIYRELAGGTTSANTLHGSANAIGGQNAVIKFRWGKPYDEMIFEGAPAGVKFALGENPKQSNGGGRRGAAVRYPVTRPGVEEVIRERFLAAQDYKRRWDDFNAGKTPMPPRKDLQLQALLEVLQGKRLVHCHSYRQDEILMLIRVADEFGFRIGTFQHVLEGYKVADEIARHGAGASTFSDWWGYKIEAYDAIPYNGALMAERGVVVSFNSDSAELARRLNLECAKAVKYGGMKPEEAIKFATINSAKQLGIDDKVGSLEVGKDADIAVWSGDPLSVYSRCDMTFVDGVKYFDREADIASREQFTKERVALLDWEKGNRAGGPPRRTDAVAEQPTVEVTSEKNVVAALPRPMVHDHLGAGLYAIVNATIHPVSGPDVPKGTVVIRDGRIEAVGATVKAPKGAHIVDAAGLHVWPGMINANTDIGLTEIGSISATIDTAETGDFNPNVRATIALNPDSELIPVARANGITTVVSAPSGGLIAGTNAAIALDGWTWEDMAFAPALGMVINFPSPMPNFFGDDENCLDDTAQGRRMLERFQRTDEEMSAELKKLKDYVTDARRYQQARSEQYDRDVRMEAMLPMLEGKMPMHIRANSVKQIKEALDWGQKEGISVVIVGGTQAWRIADLLAQRKASVILSSVLTEPGREDDPYDSAYAAPKKLADAGVRFCFGTENGTNVRNVPYHAAMAACFGLPRDVAIRSLTLDAAGIIGLENEIGSVEPGKRADLIVTTGDILEIPTLVKYEFIAGRPVDLDNKHLRLYRRYQARPHPVQ